MTEARGRFTSFLIRDIIGDSENSAVEKGKSLSHFLFFFFIYIQLNLCYPNSRETELISSNNWGFG